MTIITIVCTKKAFLRTRSTNDDQGSLSANIALSQHAMENAFVTADVPEGSGLLLTLPNSAINWRVTNVIINGNLLMVRSSTTVQVTKFPL